MIGGCMLPMMVILFGDMTGAFVTNDAEGGDGMDYDTEQLCALTSCCDEDGVPDYTVVGCEIDIQTEDEFLDEIRHFSIGQSVIASITFITSCLLVLTLNMAAENQVLRHKLILP